MNAKVITLSGSMKFWEEFIRIGRVLSMDGYIILMPFKDFDSDNLTPERKQMHEEVHNRRIDMCDKLYVINVSKYIDKSTKNEIIYAMIHYKPVTFLEVVERDQWEDILDEIPIDMIIRCISPTIRDMIENLLGWISKHATLYKTDETNFITAALEIGDNQRMLMNIIETVEKRIGDDNISFGKDISGTDSSEIISIETLLYSTPSELIDLFYRKMKDEEEVL